MYSNVPDPFVVSHNLLVLKTAVAVKSICHQDIFICSAMFSSGFNKECKLPACHDSSGLYLGISSFWKLVITTTITVGLETPSDLILLIKSYLRPSVELIFKFFLHVEPCIWGPN